MCRQSWSEVRLGTILARQSENDPQGRVGGQRPPREATWVPLVNRLLCGDSVPDIQQLLAEISHWEESAWAGLSGSHTGMQLDTLGWDPQFLLETLDEPNQVADLPLAEGPPLPIAHQADANGMSIVIRTGLTNDVGTRKLLIPAITDMDLTISQAIAIAQQEVVAESLIAPSQVAAMNRFRRSERLRKVVDHDAFPAIPIQRSFKPENRVVDRSFLQIPKVG